MAKSAFATPGDAIAALLNSNKESLNEQVKSQGQGAENITSQKDVVLSRRRAPKRRLEDAKLEERARALLRAERRMRLQAPHWDSERIKAHPGPNTIQQASSSKKADSSSAKYNMIVYPSISKEREMRKAATQGVVSIFNLIYSKQQAKEQAKKEVHDSGDIKNIINNFHENRAEEERNRISGTANGGATGELRKSFLDLLKTSLGQKKSK